jgi:hypothetical protein
MRSDQQNKRITDGLACGVPWATAAYQPTRGMLSESAMTMRLMEVSR